MIENEATASSIERMPRRWLAEVSVTRGIPDRSAAKRNAVAAVPLARFSLFRVRERVGVRAIEVKKPPNKDATSSLDCPHPAVSRKAGKGKCNALR
jgi:hypothetical protein